MINARPAYQEKSVARRWDSNTWKIMSPQFLLGIGTRSTGGTSAKFVHIDFSLGAVQEDQEYFRQV